MVTTICSYTACNAILNNDQARRRHTDEHKLRLKHFCHLCGYRYTDSRKEPLTRHSKACGGVPKLSNTEGFSVNLRQSMFGPLTILEAIPEALMAEALEDARRLNIEIPSGHSATPVDWVSRKKMWGEYKEMDAAVRAARPKPVRRPRASKAVEPTQPGEFSFRVPGPSGPSRLVENPYPNLDAYTLPHPSQSLGAGPSRPSQRRLTPEGDDQGYEFVYENDFEANPPVVPSNAIAGPSRPRNTLPTPSRVDQSEDPLLEDSDEFVDNFFATYPVPSPLRPIAAIRPPSPLQRQKRGYIQDDDDLYNEYLPQDISMTSRRAGKKKARYESPGHAEEENNIDTIYSISSWYDEDRQLQLALAADISSRVEDSTTPESLEYSTTPETSFSTTWDEPFPAFDETENHGTGDQSGYESGYTPPPGSTVYEGSTSPSPAPYVRSRFSSLDGALGPSTTSTNYLPLPLPASSITNATVPIQNPPSTSSSSTQISSSWAYLPIPSSSSSYIPPLPYNPIVNPLPVVATVPTVPTVPTPPYSGSEPSSTPRLSPFSDHDNVDTPHTDAEAEEPLVTVTPSSTRIALFKDVLEWIQSHGVVVSVYNGGTGTGISNGGTGVSNEGIGVSNDGQENGLGLGLDQGHNHNNDVDEGGELEQQPTQEGVYEEWGDFEDRLDWSQGLPVGDVFYEGEREGVDGGPAFLS